MRDLGLQAAGPRAKVRTTILAEDLDERPDLLRRDFTAEEPGKKLCGDITYVRTWPDSFISLLFWTAAPRRSWVM